MLYPVSYRFFLKKKKFILEFLVIAARKHLRVGIFFSLGAGDHFIWRAAPSYNYTVAPPPSFPAPPRVRRDLIWIDAGNTRVARQGGYPSGQWPACTYQLHTRVSTALTWFGFVSLSRLAESGVEGAPSRHCHRGIRMAARTPGVA